MIPTNYLFPSYFLAEIYLPHFKISLLNFPFWCQYSLFQITLIFYYKRALWNVSNNVGKYFKMASEQKRGCNIAE